MERAVLGCAEADHELRPEYVPRGLHPELVEAGYTIGVDGQLEMHPMDFEGCMGMVEWLATDGSAPPPESG